MRTTETDVALLAAGPARPPRWILALLGLIAIAALALPVLLVATAPRVVHLPRQVVMPKRVVPPSELPPVDPVQLQEVAPLDARAINAAIPFSPAPNPAARAFHLFGASESEERAVDCLAAAVYYEAGDDAVGERAVAQVVLNRVRHPAYPKSVCGVVFQGSERSTGCQFTFTCDGAILRRTPSAAAWTRARDIARLALHGSVYAPVGHATHYHTDWVVPYWSAKLEKITAIETHLFFRWAGWWGTPGAFNRGYSGAEPNVALMSRLSSAHQGGTAALLANTVSEGGLAVDPDSIPASAVPTSITGDANAYLVTLPKGMSADSFASLAIRTCGERPYCKFMAWTDSGKTPPKLPLSSTQVASMSFSYLRDQNLGFAKALWNCEQFKRPSPVQCMRAQPLAKPPVVPVAGAPATALPGPAPLAGVRRKTEPAPASAKPQITLTLPVAKATSAPAPKASPTARD